LGALTDPAVLVLSELMTNALRHGGERRPDRLGTRFVREAGGVRIEVTDSVTALPRMCAAGPEDEGGRGVALVETLTGGQWGVSSTGCGGKTVWAFLAVDGTHVVVLGSHAPQSLAGLA
jgi:hypothetical protein